MMTEVSSEKLLLYLKRYTLSHNSCGTFRNAFSTVQGDLLLAEEYIFAK